MTEKIKQYAEQIAQIIKDCEDIQNDRQVSDYTKQQALINAYTEIVELVEGEE